MFHRLINEGVDINERDYNNLTALWYASQECRYEMAKTLIEHGEDIEVKDKIGHTPLFTAVYWSKKATGGRLIKLLVDAGADVNAENNHGNSPLDLARMAGDFPYLDFLDKK
jgi:ankyrin repeat protein